MYMLLYCNVLLYKGGVTLNVSPCPHEVRGGWGWERQREGERREKRGGWGVCVSTLGGRAWTTTTSCKMVYQLVHMLHVVLSSSSAMQERHRKYSQLSGPDKATLVLVR